jgi:competence protein ComEC
MLLTLRPPDLLVSSDGHHVGIVEDGGNRLLMLRDSRDSFASETLTELSGMSGEVVALADWPGARCSAEFCAVELHRGTRNWRLLIGRSKDPVAERDLAAACDLSDIVIADRWLPASCRPKWLKADRNLLDRTGGLAIDLSGGHVATVAQEQGAHGWWSPKEHPRRPPKPPFPQTAADPRIGPNIGSRADGRTETPDSRAILPTPRPSRREEGN